MVPTLLYNSLGVTAFTPEVRDPSALSSLVCRRLPTRPAAQNSTLNTKL